MLACAAEAEDAVQETFLRAWNNTDRFDERKARLRTWLYRIATNVCIDMTRSVQRRAVLILREVLCWSADEVAELLGGSRAAVNSALRRARATMAAHRRPDGSGEVDDDLLDRYVKAFTTGDVDGLVALLRADATMSMPPFAWWLDGREAIRAALLGAGDACAGDRLVRTAANGSPAFAQYRDGRAFGLLIVDLRDGLIARTTTYLEPSLFPLFGLPMTLEPASRI